MLENRMLRRIFGNIIMRSFIICALMQMLLEIKEDEMGGAYSTGGRCAYRDLENDNGRDHYWET
jgi:hypothetical protein